MAAAMLLWLALTLKRAGLASVALAASVLVKYMTAPLLLVSALLAWRGEKPLRETARAVVLPAILITLGLALFFRSPSFFDGLTEVSAWKALRPIDALAGIEKATGLPLHFLNPVALAIFPVAAALAIYQLWLKPESAQIFHACLAIMAAALLTVVGNIWPWYLAWLLPLAALQPTSLLSRFITGAALAAPFMLLFWWVDEWKELKDYAAVILYASAIGFALAARPRAEHAPSQEQALAIAAPAE